MNINRFTEKPRNPGRASNCRQARQQQIDVEHLLLSLLEQQDGLAPAILRKANVNLEDLRLRARRLVDRLPQVSLREADSGQLSITGRLNQVLQPGRGGD